VHCSNIVIALTEEFLGNIFLNVDYDVAKVLLGLEVLKENRDAYQPVSFLLIDVRTLLTRKACTDEKASRPPSRSK
jgi:hypothetical protein